MIGCFVLWKCFVACLFFDWSQQPTCPQVRQSRRWTQSSPIFKHSSQPSGVFGLISSLIRSRCEQVSAIKFFSFQLLFVPRLELWHDSNDNLEVVARLNRNFKFSRGQVPPVISYPS